MQFVIGKTYETTISNYYPDCCLVYVGQQFTCHFVDCDGCAWSTDVRFYGEPAVDGHGWCVATPQELALGYVQEVLI